MEAVYCVADEAVEHYTFNVGVAEVTTSERKYLTYTALQIAEKRHFRCDLVEMDCRISAEA